jgi:spore germination protein
MVLARKLAHLARGRRRSGREKGIVGARAGVRRFGPTIGLTLLSCLIAGAGVLGALSPTATPSPLARHDSAPVHHHRTKAAAPLGNKLELLGAKVVHLPPATTPPVAAPAALVSAPIADRENLAFAPYWTLAQSPTFNLNGLSTIAYFSVGVNPDGTLDESGPGWNGFESQDLADLITRAHATNERVVLTVNDFGQNSLDALTSSPSAPATLANALIPLLAAKSLDGVNFDFEGTGSADQAGLTRLIAASSALLRANDPHWQITMDTYASSAGDPGGFYNIPALAPSVDALFVMAYGLNLAGTASAASPLTSSLFSDLQTLQQYTAAVPANKVILGIAFFGVDWPTSNGTMGATATGPATDIADAQVGAAEPQYWDPVTQTGWTSYQVASQWHESYFETPYALYDVAQLAAHYAVRGVGIWALGMEDNGPQMIGALDGLAPAGGPGAAGPQATSSSPTAVAAAPPPAAGVTTPPPAPAPTTTPPPSASTSTTKPLPASTTTTTGPVSIATYNGRTVTLNPVAPGNVDTLLPEGTVVNFESTDPRYSCLNGKSFAVYQYGLLSGKDVALAKTPTDCVTQNFAFSA